MITRRRWERVSVKLAVGVVDDAGAKIAEAMTTDICESGLGLESPVGLQVGESYGFLIAVIAAKPYKGVVRWNTPNARGNLHTVGIELTGGTREQTDAMSAAVKRWRQAVSKGLSP